MTNKTDLVLVEYHGNFADEFDVDATKVMSFKKYEELKKRMIKVLKYFGSTEIYFGTNESIVLEIEDVENLDFKYITNAEYLTLVKFNLTETGFSEILQNWTYEERYQDEEEYEKED